jgi:hypothetical protein
MSRFSRVMFIIPEAVLIGLTLFGLWATFFRSDSLAGHILDAVTTLMVGWFAYRRWRLNQRLSESARSNCPTADHDRPRRPPPWGGMDLGRITHQEIAPSSA